MSAGLDVEGVPLDEVLTLDEGKWAGYSRGRVGWLVASSAGWKVEVWGSDGWGGNGRMTGRGLFASHAVPYLLESMGFDVSACNGWERQASPADGPDERPVYFIQADNGLVKIGVSADPMNRLEGLRTGSPLRLRLLGVIPGLGVVGEHELHERFAASRSHGEWFRPTPELATYIAENARPA